MLTRLCMLAMLLGPSDETVEAGVSSPFAVEVVDAETGRGVPLIELETVNEQRFVTDSNGLVAVVDPGLMGQKVYFHVKGHGYEYPPDGFGYRGKALEVTADGSARLEVRRVNIAERLYRVTGGGIYRDSVMLGRPAPIAEPLLNARVFGQDSVLAEVYRGEVRWFWGDTNRPSYPLGNFHTPGAISKLPGDGGLDPAVGVDLSYYIDENGFAKPTAKMPGEGPTWLGGLAVLRGSDGGERMFAGYAKIRPPLSTYERGVVEWDDDAEAFRKVAAFDGLPPLHPTGHTFQRAEDDGTTYVYYCTPFPLTRVPADPEAMADPSRYEGYSPLVTGTTFEDRLLDRDDRGRLTYDWKPQTPPLSQDQQDQLLDANFIAPGEGLLALRDPESGRAVRAHGGTTYWNDHRGRWVAVFVEAGGGSSFLGEVWYAEADTPLGPWVYAKKIVTHERYTFYNPKHHPFFDQDGGRRIYFEGTYASTFSGNPVRTPLYDYNQVMYRLDLDDPRLNLPVAVRADGVALGGSPVGVEVFAKEQPGEGTVPVFVATRNDGGRPLVVGRAPGPDAVPAFHAMPADAEAPPMTTAPLYEFLAEDGSGRRYATAGRIEGYRRNDRPLCRVWRDPIAVDLPGD